MGSMYADTMGTYYYLWRNATDNTFINESAYLNLSTQRTSAKFDGNLTVTYDGGDNRTDKVYIDGTFISNITAGRSPDTYTVPGSLIDVPCEVRYVFNASVTNVTKSDLDYYSFDGCEYDESTCDVLQSSFTLTGAIMKVPPYFIFLFALLIVFTALGALLFK